MELITMIYLKFKIFLAGVLTWSVFHYFEVQVWNTKFNAWKFITSVIIFWILTEFSHLLIQWNFIEADVENEARIVVLSIMIASLLYLFIPFVLEKENRDRFITSLLEKFWFYKKK